MLKKLVAMVLALSFVGILAMAPNADARRCARGFEDIDNVCVPE